MPKIGAERSKWLYPIRSLLDSGAIVAFGENINVVDEANYADAVTELSTLLHTEYVSNIIGD